MGIGAGKARAVYARGVFWHDSMAQINRLSVNSSAASMVAIGGEGGYL